MSTKAFVLLLLLLAVCVCGQSTPPSRRRGIRVTLAANYSAKLATHAMFHEIIDAENNTEYLLRFLRVNKFTALTITDDIHKLTNTDTRLSKLRSFITNARMAGIQTVESVVWGESAKSHSAWKTEYTAYFDAIVSYQNGTTADSEMFDGIISNVGIGNSTMKVRGWGLAWCTEPIEYAKNLYGRMRNGAFTYGFFLSPSTTIDTGDLQTLTEFNLYDNMHILQPADPENVWGDVAGIFQTVVDSGVDIDVGIIFEDMSAHDAWFSAQTDPFHEAERIVLRDFEADALYSATNGNFKGFGIESYEDAVEFSPPLPTVTPSRVATKSTTFPPTLSLPTSASATHTVPLPHSPTLTHERRRTTSATKSVSLLFVPQMYPVAVHIPISPAVLADVFGWKQTIAEDVVSGEVQQLMIANAAPSNVSVEIVGNNVTGFTMTIVVHSTNIHVGAILTEALGPSHNNSSSGGGGVTTLAQLVAVSEGTVILCENSTIIEERCKPHDTPSPQPVTPASPVACQEPEHSDSACDTACIAGSAAGGSIFLIIIIVIAIIVSRRGSGEVKKGGDVAAGIADAKTITDNEPIAVVSDHGSAEQAKTAENNDV